MIRLKPATRGRSLHARFSRLFWCRSLRGLRRRTSLHDRQQNTNDKEWPEHRQNPNNESARRTVAGVILEVRLNTAHASVVHKVSTPAGEAYALLKGFQSLFSEG